MMSMDDERRTLLFLLKDDELLLAMKKRGFGAGLWNGVGGKIELGETIEQAMIRECQEEIGVTPTQFARVGQIDFYGGSSSEPWHLQIYIYISAAWRGEPSETDEMAPKWYKFANIPYNNMWDDDKYWLPEMLRGSMVDGTFYFNENNIVIKHDLNKVGDI